MCSSPPLVRRRQWRPGWGLLLLLGRVAVFLFFLEPKGILVVVAGLCPGSPFVISYFMGDVVVVATLYSFPLVNIRNLVLIW
jgi:hypothetical protein